MKTLIFLSVFLSITLNVYAEDSQIQIPQNKTEIEQKIVEKQAALQSQINKRQPEIRAIFDKQTDQTKLQITAQERISKAITIIFERMNAFVIRYDGIVQRLDVKISEMESGEAKSQAELLVIEAKTSLLDTTALITAAQKEIEESLNTKTSLEAIRLSVELCKESLKKTHDSLVLVIQNIKATDIEESLSLE